MKDAADLGQETGKGRKTEGRAARKGRRRYHRRNAGAHGAPGTSARPHVDMRPVPLIKRD